MWSIDALWPATTAIIGVYDHPPPEDTPISSVYVAPETANEQLWTRAAFKAGRDITRGRDWIHSHIPGLG